MNETALGKTIYKNKQFKGIFYQSKSYLLSQIYSLETCNIMDYQVTIYNMELTQQIN